MIVWQTFYQTPISQPHQGLLNFKMMLFLSFWELPAFAKLLLHGSCKTFISLGLVFHSLNLFIPHLFWLADVIATITDSTQHHWKPPNQRLFLSLLEIDPGRWLCILTQVSCLFITSLSNCTFLIPISGSIASFCSHCYKFQAMRRLFVWMHCVWMYYAIS